MGAISPTFSPTVYAYNVSTATDSFDLQLQFDAAVSCIINDNGVETPCQPTQTVALTKLISIVVVALYYASDSPAVFTNYTLTVYQPICTLTSFSVSLSYADPIVCVSRSPPDEYTVASACITTSASPTVELSYTAQNSCDDVYYEYFEKDTWVNCTLAVCPLAALRNRFRVSFSNSLTYSDLNISNGASHTFILPSLTLFSHRCCLERY